MPHNARPYWIPFDDNKPVTKPVSSTLQRLARRLIPDEEGQKEFISSVMEPADFPVAVVWLNHSAVDAETSSPFTSLEPHSWIPDYVQLIPIKQRPGRHEMHEQGAYYCLDPSSVFMAGGLSVVDKADVVLDVCASPGGKSVLAWRALQPALLFSNEVIGKRVPALISNLKRCRIGPARVLSADTSVLAEQSALSADLVIVDAPCSGQSLVARGKPSPGCFHPATINMNANRQRRILANAARTVAPKGWLLYMTCTYSLKENERNVEWFLKRHSEFEAMDIPILSEFQSSLSQQPCYRMWPGSGQGAGGFTVAFRRTGQVDTPSGSLHELPVRWQSDAR